LLQLKVTVNSNYHSIPIPITKETRQDTTYNNCIFQATTEKREVL